MIYAGVPSFFRCLGDHGKPWFTKGMLECDPYPSEVADPFKVFTWVVTGCGMWPKFHGSFGP